MNNKEYLLKLGAKVKEIRESKRMTQVDLAGKIEGNIDTTNISRIETGRTNPTIITIYRISEALEVSINALIPEK